MAVSQDLKVHMLEDANATKLANRQQVLKSAVQKGEPKCLGVSGLMSLCRWILNYCWNEAVHVSYAGLLTFPRYISLV